MTVRRAPQLQRRGLHILLYGNRPQANQWLPWAKKKLHTLERYHVGFSGKSFGTMVYDVRQDVRVIIKCAKDQKWIIIEAGAPGLYMESGILDFINTAPLNENTYLPAQLHYGTDIDAIRSPGAALGELKLKEISDLRLDGENRAEGASKALGCKDKKKEITISYGEITRTFSAATPTYCPNLYFFKNVQDFMPPSMFSGKLRLLVQAIYGSKRRDYTVDLSIPSTTGLSIGSDDGFTPWFANNSGLFSAAGYEYYRIRIGIDGNITARKLFPTSAGKKLRRYLINNPGIPADRKLRYETYLLSTLDFSNDHKPVKIGETGPYYQHGTPFGYGPSWNWKGDTGYVVTIRRKSGTTNVWTSRMLKLSVSEHPTIEALEDGKLSASVSIHEGIQDFTFRVNRDILWDPNWLGSGMKLFVTQKDAFDGPTHEDHDVPMYALYDYANDQFNVVRHYNEEMDAEAFNKNVADSMSVSPHVDCGNSGCDVWSEASDAAKHGFYTTVIDGGSEGFDARAVRGNDVRITAAELVGEGLVGDSTGIRHIEQSGALIGTWETRADQAGCGSVPDSFTGAEAHHANFSGTSFSVGAGSVFRLNSMLVIPIYDCDAVYLGLTESVEAQSVQAKKTTTPAKLTREVQFYTGSFLDFQQDPDNMEPVGDQIQMRVEFSRLDVGVNNQGEEAAVWSPTFNGDLTWSRTKVIHRANGVETTAFNQAAADDGGAIGSINIPSCVDMPVLTPDGGWIEEGSGESNGFEFNPVVFPDPEIALPVISKSTPVFYSFRATKNPGGSDPSIHDGSYGFDDISTNGGKFGFSFLGFA